MAVPEQTPYSEHTGNGVTKSFALGFICESKDHLIVLVDEIEPPIATWSLIGGNVVFTAAPVSGSKINLQRNTPFGRTTDFQSFNNSFRPQSVNGDFDRVWLKLQELGVANWLLKNYVDRKDDELKAYLMEEIRKQGVALDQLDNYYNYLMQRLAQIAVNGGWEASFVVDATGQNQQKINDGISSLNELRLIDPKKKGRRVYLNSVIADKNLGGGTFVSTNKSSLVDNGGTIVGSANPNLMWVRVEYDVMTPEMFGCIGDGVTDDTIGMTKFGLAKYNHKVASNDYFLTTTPVFNIYHGSSIIDFSNSKIIGTAFSYTAIQVKTEIPVDSILFKCGSYDGGHEVNGYVELTSSGVGRSEAVTIECYSDLRNFANAKNDRGVAAIRSNIPCRSVITKNPVATNMRNINGVVGTSGSAGVVLTNYEQLGVIENPTINGVYTTTGADADGLILYERKGYATTGNGIGIVKNANLKQCAGRGIKSQSNLVVRGVDIELESVNFGSIITNWKGIDAQLGGMNCDDVSFNLKGAALFSAVGDTCLFQSSGSAAAVDQSVSKIKLSGGSNIRYLMQLTTNNHKSIGVNAFEIVGAHSTLSGVYVVAGISVLDKISIKNVSGQWSASGRLFLDQIYNGDQIDMLDISENQVDGISTLNVSKFNKIRVIAPTLTLSGTLNYSDISEDSEFYYSYETSASGGLTYSNPNIPAWANRYVHYERGVVYSALRNNILTYSNNKFYQSLGTSPTEVV